MPEILCPKYMKGSGGEIHFHLFISTAFILIARVADCDHEAKLLENRLSKACSVNRALFPVKFSPWADVT